MSVGGIVEADQTSLQIPKRRAQGEEKGRAHPGNVAARPNAALRRALPVLITSTVTDRHDAGEGRYRERSPTWRPIVAKDTLLISDGEKAYGAFAAKQDILHVWIIASKGEHVWRGYHIHNVNAYAQRSEDLDGSLSRRCGECLRQLPRLAPHDRSRW